MSSDNEDITLQCLRATTGARENTAGGQYIFVIPEFDMVVVFTAGGYCDTRPIGLYRVVEDYIFAALVE